METASRAPTPARREVPPSDFDVASDDAGMRCISLGVRSSLAETAIRRISRLSSRDTTNRAKIGFWRKESNLRDDRETARDTAATRAAAALGFLADGLVQEARPTLTEFLRRGAERAACKAQRGCVARR
jgi:hypothetical protein